MCFRFDLLKIYLQAKVCAFSLFYTGWGYSIERYNHFLDDRVYEFFGPRGKVFIQNLKNNKERWLNLNSISMLLINQLSDLLSPDEVILLKIVRVITEENIEKISVTILKKLLSSHLFLAGCPFDYRQLMINKISKELLNKLEGGPLDREPDNFFRKLLKNKKSPDWLYFLFCVEHINYKTSLSF